MSCTASIYTVPVPGPQGAAGTDGTNGTDGQNAFTTTTASFVMPAELANVTITVVSSDAFAVGQIVYVKSGGASGYFSVASKPSATSLELTNLEDAATSAYATNSPPTTVFASSGSVQPGGLQGPAGDDAATGAPTSAKYILQTADAALSSAQSLGALATGLVKSTTTTGVVTTIPVGVADTNIAPVDDASGLTSGEALFATASGIESKTAAATRTALGLVVGTDVQAADATLTSLANLGTVADRIAYTTGVDAWAETTLSTLGRSVIGAATESLAYSALGLLVDYGRLGSSTIADLSITGGETTINMVDGPYIIDRIIVSASTVDLSVGPVTGGVFTAPASAGITLAVDQTLAALTSATKFKSLVLEAIVGTDTRTDAKLYFNIGTPAGSAGTAEIVVFGWRT